MRKRGRKEKRVASEKANPEPVSTSERRERKTLNIRKENV